MHKKNILQILSCFRKHNPKPTTELQYTNHYTLLVAIILSAQTTDKQVNKITQSLFQELKSPEDAVIMGTEILGAKIASIGLWRNKARNIVAMSKILLERFNSAVPVSFSDLLALPGVGRKSANAFLGVAFHAPVIAVDTHVFRVSNRIGLVSTKTVSQTEDALLKIIPRKDLVDAHHWLVLHGRYICKALKPQCNKCCIAQYCMFFQKLNKPKADC